LAHHQPTTSPCALADRAREPELRRDIDGGEDELAIVPVPGVAAQFVDLDLDGLEVPDGSPWEFSPVELSPVNSCAARVARSSQRRTVEVERPSLANQLAGPSKAPAYS